MSEKNEGGTPSPEKVGKLENFGELLQRVAELTGRPIEGLKKSFGVAWYDKTLSEDLLNDCQHTRDELQEWVKQAERGQYSTLEEGKSKLEDYEAVVDTLESYLHSEL